MRKHNPGECPSDYGNYEDFDNGYVGCSGWASFVEDPFASEIYDDHTPGWYCEGELYSSSMEI